MHNNTSFKFFETFAHVYNYFEFHDLNSPKSFSWEIIAMGLFVFVLRHVVFVFLTVGMFPMTPGCLLLFVFCFFIPFS